MLFRKSAALAAGNFRDRPRGIDQDLWLRLARIGPLANLPDRLASYRQHDHNLTASFDDFQPTERGVASTNATTLFTAESAESAMALWDDLYPKHQDRPIAVSRLKDLRRLAITEAKRIGEPNNYFLATPFWRIQRGFVMRNVARSALRVDLATLERLERLRNRLRVSR